MKPDNDLGKEPEFSVSITDRPDGWLLRQWKSGDEAAAEVLFERYSMRLVALVASRLSAYYRAKVDPSEVVQSALGSFFDAAKHSRIQVSESVSLWRLLATFARRKMSRTIEHLAAAKRGGDWGQISLELLESQGGGVESGGREAEMFLKHLRESLSDDLYAVAEGLMSQQTQREVAKSLGIDERSVRRRTKRIREQLTDASAKISEAADPVATHGNVPVVKYNQFVLGKLIGHGGFGKVYRAAMQADGATVSVKFLRKSFWKNKEARDSFVREISIASRIKHPNVLRYLGYGESPHGGPYILSEWIDGKSLESFQAPAEKEFASWLLGVCEAIDAVHAVGLVHGDLTPANILIDVRSRAVVTDFGFSQASQGNQSPILGGTLGFAAPEQLDSAFGKISFKTDIYAIGGLIHWFAFGRPPVVAASMAGALMKTISSAEILECDRELGDEATIRPIPQNLQEIMQRSLRCSPAERTLTIGQIVELLSK